MLVPKPEPATVSFGSTLPSLEPAVDDYFGRIAKYFPAEMIVVWTASVGLVKGSGAASTAHLWILFGICAMASLLRVLIGREPWQRLLPGKPRRHMEKDPPRWCSSGRVSSGTTPLINSPPNTDMPPNAVKLLYAEDEVLLRLMLADALSEAGFQVFEASDGLTKKASNMTSSMIGGACAEARTNDTPGQCARTYRPSSRPWT
jgi:hypothetical protein